VWKRKNPESLIPLSEDKRSGGQSGYKSLGLESYRLWGTSENFFSGVPQGSVDIPVLFKSRPGMSTLQYVSGFKRFPEVPFCENFWFFEARSLFGSHIALTRFSNDIPHHDEGLKLVVCEIVPVARERLG